MNLHVDLFLPDVLLCHDDELEDRKIAYILYLVPPWTKEDGGWYIQCPTFLFHLLLAPKRDIQYSIKIKTSNAGELNLANWSWSEQQKTYHVIAEVNLWYMQHDTTMNISLQNIHTHVYVCRIQSLHPSSMTKEKTWWLQDTYACTCEVSLKQVVAISDFCFLISGTLDLFSVDGNFLSEQIVFWNVYKHLWVFTPTIQCSLRWHVFCDCSAWLSSMSVL